MDNKYDLTRFKKAHRDSYQSALNEIKRGRKESHWMWYIFPQIHGLGMSEISQYYAIKSVDEARAFLEDPYLSANLNEICLALLELEINDALAVLGYPDNMKLKSSMTLFAAISEDNSVFHRVIDKFFGGNQDERTLEILKHK